MPKKTETIVKRIQYNVSQSGKVTPIAQVKRLNLDGIDIEEVSLNTIPEMIELDVRAGDTVKIVRDTNTVPKIEKITQKRTENRNDEINVVAWCPMCDHRIIFSRNYEYSKCITSRCKKKIIKQIMNFVAENKMNIKGLSKRAIKSLVYNDLIHGIQDLYKLTEEKIAKIYLWEGVNGKNKLKAIEASKNQPAYRVLSGLKIKSIGKITAKKILNHFGSIENIMNKEAEEMNIIPKIPISSTNMFNIRFFFLDELKIDMVNELVKLGVNTKQKKIYNC